MAEAATPTPLNLDDIESLIASAPSIDSERHPIPVSNTKAVRAYIATSEPTGISSVKYRKGEQIVDTGMITSDILKANADFNYSYVPLGFIVKGDVIVLKGAKATKKLSEGDFIGLFETADWLLTKRSRQIGDWTLVADTDAEILFFTASALTASDPDTEAFRSYLIELAREDHVPKPLTSLPLLDWVAEHTTKNRLSDCVIIVHTHMLPNSFPLFRHLSSLVDFGKIYAIEKPYSTVKKTINELVWAGFEVIPVKVAPAMPYDFAVAESMQLLWKKVIEDQKKIGFKHLLIIDDGADVWHSIPWGELKGVHIAGVEQTQRGITRIANSPLRLPSIVNVASSGVKKIVESEFIGQSVVKKLKEYGEIDKAKTIGILGMGSIGQAVERALKDLGRDSIYYDLSRMPGSDAPPNSRPSIDALLNDSDLIIGSTGTDSLKGIPFERAFGDKVLASCSSANVEFASLLKFATPPAGPFNTVDITVHDGLTCHVLNGGYPINFDREKDSTPDEDIVLTRSMLYIGAMQAAELLAEGNDEEAIYNLDRLAQKKLLERWLEEKAKLGQIPRITKDEIDGIVDFKSVEVGKDMPTVWQDRPEYLRQLDKDGVHITTRPYLTKVESHTEPYESMVFGKSITVIPGVMSPEYDWAGLYMVDCLPESFTGQDVLELGPGSGLVSVFAGLRGAHSVTAADINPAAVENTRLNLAKFNIPNATVVESDIFSSVPRMKYDTIIFNLPYHDAVPANDLEKGVIDMEYAAMTGFLSQAREFLKENGKMYVGFSQSGNVPRFLQEIQKNGWHLERMDERNTYDREPRFVGPDFHYNCQVYTLTP